MVEPVFAFDTALGFWTNPRIPNVPATISGHSATAAINSMFRPISNYDLEQLSSQPFFQYLPRPYDILVPRREARRTTKLARYKLWQTVLPDNMLVEFENVKYATTTDVCHPLVVSPELCFCQMAKFLMLPELVELGYELCGSYSISPCSPKGLLTRAPRTTPQNLVRAADRLTGLANIRLARIAARLVLPNSRSPKESQIAMLMTFPTKRSGYNLKAPLLNHAIQLDSALASILHNNVLIPDFYFPHCRLVIEYDSRDWHSRAEVDEHDARKRSVYALLGLDVITLTYGQLHDFAAFDTLLRSLAQRINGYRSQIPSSRIVCGRRKLHRTLLYEQKRPRQISPAHIEMFGSQDQGFLSHPPAELAASASSA